MRFTIPGRSWLGASRVVQWFPADLVGASTLAVLASAVAISPSWGGPVQVLLGLALVLFVPGYAVLAALFPARGAREDGGATARRRIDWPERLGLSFGTSVAMLPFLGLGLAAAGRPFAATTVTLPLAAVAVVGSFVGAVRRWRLAPEERYRVPVGRWLREAARTLRDRSRHRLALDVALVAAVVLSTAGFAYALAAPMDGSAYTDATLLTENEDGERVADAPDALAQGQAEQLVLRVQNHEGAETEYTAVVELERVDAADGTVTEDAELNRFSFEIGDRITVYLPHTVEPTMAGEDLRLSYYLYEGSAPDDPSPETAYRHVFTWVDVSG